MGVKVMERKLGTAAEIVQAALGLVCDLGREVRGDASKGAVLALVEELAETLLDLEHVTGARTARSLFDAPGTDESFNRVVYTNLYNVVRILGETLLLLNGFKATIDQHHKTVILASKLLMNDEKMETVFARLDRMRKNRNTIDYDLDALDVSAQTIKQAMTDTEQFASKVELLISKKEGQHKLQL